MHERFRHAARAAGLLFATAGLATTGLVASAPAHAAPAAAAAATAPADLILSLHEAGRLALQRDPRLQAADALVAASTADIAAARSGYRPRASLDTQIRYERLFPQSSLPPPLQVPDLLAPAAITLTAQQPLYTGGLTPAQVEAAQHGLDSSRDQRSQTEQGLLLQAAAAYLDVRRDRDVLRLQLSNVETLQQAESDTQKRYAAGTATRTDIAQARARRAEAEAGREQAQASLRSSEAAFLRIVGGMPGSLATTWPQPQTPDDLGAALRYVGTTPAVQSADAQVAAAQAQIKAARAGHRPTLALEGQALEQNDAAFSADSYHDWRVQLKASLPLYQGGAVDAQIAQARARAAQAQAEADDARAAATQTIAQSWARYTATAEEIRAYEDAAVADAQALDNLRKELEVGTRTTLDLLNAEREALSSQVNLAGARHDRAVAAFRLLYDCGLLQLDALP